MHDMASLRVRVAMAAAALFWCCFSVGFRASECKSRYDTSGRPVPGMLNVHLVPHTHDDVGWLKTVDQYFVGSNNSIQTAAVQYILDSVIAALQEDENRKFIYVEQAFFQRWWRVQDKSTRNIVKDLVDSGQLEFINGGWCMHDEATTHYIDMIDQTTLGHQFIKKQFDKVPRIGWQIDPFGHSAVQAYLLGAEIGFDAVFFARADYQDVMKRRKDRTMEVIWRGSKSLGQSAQIFAGVLHHHYDPPTGFSFEITSNDPLIQDDPLLFDYNVQDRVELFVQSAQNQSQEFRTNHIMWTMGEDFAYENANTWFKQMDKLIHYVNKDGRVNVFYSTPSIYVDAKNAINESWPLKEEDFFPYADHAHGYWTGYFTSRPALKGYVRKLSGFLQAARQLEVFVGKSYIGPNTDSLEEAMAILQHHDGVSGTEKQHVTDDYAKRLAIGYAKAEMVVNSALSALISRHTNYNLLGLGADGLRMEGENSRENSIVDTTTSGYSIMDGSPILLEQCPLLNISYCPPTEVDLTGAKVLVVVAYNPLGWEREEIIRLPVSSDKLVVYDSAGKAVSAQVIALTNIAKNIREKFVRQSLQNDILHQQDLFTLVFRSIVPPLGYSSFIIKYSQDSENYTKTSSIQDGEFAQELVLQSTFSKIVVSNTTGSIKQMQTGKATAVSMKQSYCWYNGSDGNTKETPGQSSGAYVFRPNSSTCFPVGSVNKSALISLIKGPIVEEVHQQFSPWVSQIIRLYSHAQHAEVEYMIGPIPIEDNLGKEVVTKLSTDILSQKEFYTDSNGRDFLKRVRNYRTDWDLEINEEIAGNYYPLNSGVFLKDDSTEFSILVDRAIGGSSIKDGELELMLHRRLLHDDGKGVAEALNETVCSDINDTREGLVVQGTFLVNIDSSENATVWRRNQIQRVLSPLQLSFSVIPEADTNKLQTPHFSFLATGYQLPPNVALITLKELEDGEVLLRLAHLFERDEHKSLSMAALVDLQQMFSHKKIDNVVEMSLSANQKRSEMKPLRWQVEESSDKITERPPVRGKPLADDVYIVELASMEIRTFLVSFDDDINLNQ